MKISTVTRSVTTAHVPDIGEFELTHTPIDFLDTHIKVVGNKAVIAYLVQDEGHGMNPFEDEDGYGQLHHHPRSNYGSRKNQDYYDLLGLDSDGNPKIDEEKVQKVWSDRVMALPDGLFTFPFEFAGEEWENSPVYSSRGEPVSYQLKLKTLLADEEAGDYDIGDQCYYAWKPLDLSNELYELLVDRMEDAIAWVYQQIEDDCWVGTDPNAVLIDLYEHGGCVWSVSGTGMTCSWDSSGGAAVWVPDSCALETINYYAPVFNYAYIEETGMCKGRNLKYVLKHSGDAAHSDNFSELWAIAKDIAQNMNSADIQPTFNGHEKALEFIAKGAMDEYNAWCSGQIYGCVVEVFEREDEDSDWVQTSIDDCWGFRGDDYAEEALLSDYFNPAVSQLENENGTNSVV